MSHYNQKQQIQQIEALKTENAQLKERLRQQNEKAKHNRKTKAKWSLKLAGWFAGADLRNSTKQLYKELPNPSQETTGAFFGSLAMRLTKIGLIGLLIAMQPLIQTYILVQQNKKLDIQNDLIIGQNEKIEKQVYLEEASRRNNLVLLMDNILQSVNEEITETNKTLSEPLIGRIAALSHGFQPYYFLEDSTNLTDRKYSPERGQLLLALANSGIDTLTLDEIYSRATFNNAYLVEADLKDLYLKGVMLNRANLRKTNARNVNLKKVRFNGANLSEVYFYKVNLSDAYLGDSNLSKAYFGNSNLSMTWIENSDLTETWFNNSDLRNARLRSSTLHKCQFSKTILMGADLECADLIEIKLKNNDIRGISLKNIELNETIVYDSLWLENLEKNYVKNFTEIKKAYKIVSIDKHHNSYKLIKK